MIPLIYKRLLQIGKIAGTLTFLFGIPYGVWQYSEKKEEARIEQSLKLFDKFNSPPITTYRENISKAVSEHSAELEAAAKDEQDYVKAVVQLAEKSGIESSLWMLMDFFDGVTICVVNNICDAHTVAQLFAERAKDLFITFYPYINDRRKGPTSAFAVGLETVATSARTLKK